MTSYILSSIFLNKTHSNQLKIRSPIIVSTIRMKYVRDPMHSSEIYLPPNIKGIKLRTAITMIIAIPFHPKTQKVMIQVIKLDI